MKKLKQTIIRRKSNKIIKIIKNFLIIFTICFLILLLIFLLNLNNKQIINPVSKIYLNLENKLNNNENQVYFLMKKNNITYKSIKKTDFGYEIILANNSLVLLSNQKDLKSQIASLQLIQSHFTIEGKTIKNIDFRFNEPVVSF